MILLATTSLALTSNILNSLLHLGFFLVPLLPLVWFIKIPKTVIRIFAYVLYVVFLIPLYLVSSLAILFTLNDVLSNNNNGFRRIYEKPLNNKETLVIYRTPDKGALGGDFIKPAKVRKILPGIISRKVLWDTQIRYSPRIDSNYIKIEGKRVYLPDNYFLWSKGKLK